jgi:geranylgeranyl pyrophosphate synthase
MSPAAAAFDVSAYLAREGMAAEEALDRAVTSGTAGLPSDVTGAIRHGVLGGGKRLRPILCAASFRACGGAGEDGGIYDLAVCLELIHAYSLMHDDLPCMDDAELRRGRPATHRVHGVEVTMLAGAALIPMAVRQALKATRALGKPESTAMAVARELTGAAGAGGMVGGQVLDLGAEGRRLEPTELNTLHRLKTGAMIRASLRIGALAAGATDAVRERLDSFGRALGLAFQIADDVLDATASAGELGKNPSDQALGKSTYVSLYGLDEARRRGTDEIRRAVAALDGATVDATVLRALAHYVTSRRR